VRVVAGSRKGHRIDAPKGVVTRPTSDRVARDDDGSGQAQLLEVRLDHAS